MAKDNREQSINLKKKIYLICDVTSAKKRESVRAHRGNVMVYYVCRADLTNQLRRCQFASVGGRSRGWFTG